MDTIFALSTARGKAGVSIMRISGPAAFEACEAICGDVPSPRIASLRLLKTSDGSALDQALVLTFDEGSSFTGEAIVEFHCHGSVAVTAKLSETLAGLSGLRLAEPGEFTRRALENDCLDLSQVEGLADLIEADTEAQRKQALRVLSGDLGQRVDGWRQSLIRAAALIEVTIDFADEDVPVDVSPEVKSLLNKVKTEIEREIEGFSSAERIRNGFEVAIVGPPNAGKSTLLNYLAGREAAITSRHAGTTRDVIEVRMDLDGLAVTLLDTAGLREAVDEVEAIGIDRARMRAQNADLRLILVEYGQDPELLPRQGDVVRTAKADLLPDVENSVSGLTGAGISELVREISSELSGRAAGGGLAIRERHRDALVRGASAIKISLEMVDDAEANPEFVAEEIRTAVRALDSLIGRVDIENVLDEIFASFCLGK